LYYYSTDKGPTAEDPIHQENIKIRDMSFGEPVFDIITN